jgi:NAD(P)-dependent dehydrogenase (short-subunit alcohol dehydrogenase family)
MGKAVLVTEGDTPLGAALVRLFSSKGFSVVTTTPAGGGGSEQRAVGEGDTVHVVSWNRRSPLSARNVLLSSLNAFNALDEVFILEAPCPSANALHEAASAEIERSFDEAKGPVFLTREVLSYFPQRKRGLLALVSYPSAGADTAVQAAMREGFRGFASCLMASYGGGSESHLREGSPKRAGESRFETIVNGFMSLGAGVEEFAGFIDNTLEEKARKISGHWFVFQSRRRTARGLSRAD